MKIYIVIKNSVYLEETSVEVLKATTSLEEAKSILNTQLEGARQDYAGQDNIVFENSEMGFESYVEGEYNYDHICVNIETQELNLDLSKEYWKETISDYLNNSCEGEKFTLLSDEEAEEVVNDTVNKFQEDDAVFNEIDSSIEWYLHHHDIVQEKEKYAEKLCQARRKIEEDYGLEDGETDGMNLREIEKLVHEEEGSLDRYISDVEEND